MDVTLARPRRGDANQPRLLLQLRNRGAAAVPHARTQAAHQLVNHRCRAALVRDPAFDPFGNQLVGCLATLEIELVLEVAVPAASAHRAD